jgi:hypothetical protein
MNPIFRTYARAKFREFVLKWFDVCEHDFSFLVQTPLHAGDIALNAPQVLFERCDNCGRCRRGTVLPSDPVMSMIEGRVPYNPILLKRMAEQRPQLRLVSPISAFLYSVAVPTVAEGTPEDFSGWPQHG